MSHVVTIEKKASVKLVDLVVEADTKDPFVGTLVQTGELPFTFYYGKRRILRHACAQCQQQVEAEFAFGKIMGLGPLSRQGFKDNKALLDSIGQLFKQHLYHQVDSNGFETYMYLSSADSKKGALLNVSYYRCAHCQGQYLVLYQRQLKDDRPPFEPNEILIEEICHVAFNHDELLEALELQPAIQSGS